VKRPHGVVVASKNPDKVAEVEAVLADLDPPVIVIPGHEWGDIEETEDTLEGNALLKARAVCLATGHAAIADDTGLEVDALGGGPGVRTARFAGEEATYDDNVEKMLVDLHGVTDRGARFRTAIAIVMPSGEELVVEGILEGTIAESRQGSGGFGYDPIFVVGERTLAEIPTDEKNRISHRGLALRALTDQLG
jgi:XTP/dITP diphosphohydrolase